MTVYNLPQNLRAFKDSALVTITTARDSVAACVESVISMLNWGKRVVHSLEEFYHSAESSFASFQMIQGAVETAKKVTQTATKYYNKANNTLAAFNLSKYEKWTLVNVDRDWSVLTLFDFNIKFEVTHNVKEGSSSLVLVITTGKKST